MILFLFILMVSVVIIFEYNSHSNLILYRLKKLNAKQLEELDIQLIYSKKSKLEYSYLYKYKNVTFKVIRSRYTPMNVIGSAEVLQKNKKICNYTQLPASFKTRFYWQYLSVRYPGIISRIVCYRSARKKSKYIEFCEREGLV